MAPSRRTFDLMNIIFWRAATAAAALPSWRRPMTALTRVNRKMTSAVPYCLNDPRFGGFDVLGDGGDFLGVLDRDDHDTVLVTAHEVTGANRDAVDRERLLGRHQVRGLSRCA